MFVFLPVFSVSTYTFHLVCATN